MYEANSAGVFSVTSLPSAAIAVCMAGVDSSSLIALLSLSMISAGVPRGATRPKNVLASHSARPSSAMVGVDGMRALRLLCIKARARFSIVNEPSQHRDVLERGLYGVRQNRVGGFAAAAIGNT